MNYELFRFHSELEIMTKFGFYQAISERKLHLAYNLVNMFPVAEGYKSIVTGIISKATWTTL